MFPQAKKFGKCESGRKCMSLTDKRLHFATCSHPQCVYLLSVYKRIAEESERLLSNPKQEKSK